MNKDRRNRLAAAKAALEALKTQAESIHSDIESVCEEETEAFGNLAESLQSGEREEAKDAVESIRELSEELVNGFDEVCGQIEAII